MEPRYRDFERYIQERQLVYKRRRSGEPRPWTADQTIHSNRLSCVIRDDDRASQVAREIILGLDCNRGGRAAATFRLYNRPETLIALHPHIMSNREIILRTILGVETVFGTAFRIVIDGRLWNTDGLATIIVNCCWTDYLLDTAEEVHGLLISRGYGPFLAYQTLQDLRWMGHRYSDEDSWCYIGPGAVRGMKRLLGVWTPSGVKGREGRKEGVGMQEQGAWLHEHSPILRQLLSIGQSVASSFNMFEVEHNLCEFDKYERYRLGETGGDPFVPRDADPNLGAKSGRIFDTELAQVIRVIKPNPHKVGTIVHDRVSKMVDGELVSDYIRAVAELNGKLSEKLCRRARRFLRTEVAAGRVIVVGQ